MNWISAVDFICCVLIDGRNLVSFCEQEGSSACRRREFPILEITSDLINLENHPDGMNVAHFVQDDTGAAILNLPCAKFIQHDSSFASWLLASMPSQVTCGLIGCMTDASISQNLHRDFSSSSTTKIMHLYDRLKAIKLVHQSMRDYLTEIQTTCDNLASCGHLIEEM